MINIDVENKQITMDESYKSRSALHYAKLLEEFERRRENNSNTNYDETDKNIKNLLNMLGQRLKFEDESKLKCSFGLPSKEDFHNNDFLPLSANDSVWSDQDD